MNGIVDTGDSIYSRLLLWQDRNHNGISDPEELRPAAEYGMIGVGSQYRESKRKDRHGNQFGLKGKSWWVAGDGQVVERSIFDVSLLSR